LVLSAAYSGCRRSKDQPNSPVRPSSRGAAGGGGGGAVSSNRACGGETGAGMLSHFMEYTSSPFAVLPIGAQLSTRAALLAGCFAIGIGWP
jgi:hypothetical protein